MTLEQLEEFRKLAKGGHGIGDWRTLVQKTAREPLRVEAHAAVFDTTPPEVIERIRALGVEVRLISVDDLHFVDDLHRGEVGT